MARSLKKGFFVDDHLAKKVEKAVAANDKKVIKTWPTIFSLTKTGTKLFPL